MTVKRLPHRHRGRVRFYDTRPVAAAVDAAATTADIDAALSPFATAYGLNVQFASADDTTGAVQYTAIPAGSEPQLRLLARQLVECMACYPPDFVQATVCDNIVFTGIITSSQNATGLAYGPESSFFVAAAAVDVTQPANQDYFRGVFHHEFLHMIDATWGSDTAQQSAWEALNPVGFTYGSYQTRPAGFTTAYGAGAYVEDRADTHKCYMGARYYWETKGIEAGDPVIGQKADLLRQLLTSKSAAWVGDIYAQANGAQPPQVQSTGLGLAALGDSPLGQ